MNVDLYVHASVQLVTPTVLVQPLREILWSDELNKHASLISSSELILPLQFAECIQFGISSQISQNFRNHRRCLSWIIRSWSRPYNGTFNSSRKTSGFATLAVAYDLSCQSKCQWMPQQSIKYPTQGSARSEMNCTYPEPITLFSTKNHQVQDSTLKKPEQAYFTDNLWETCCKDSWRVLTNILFWVRKDPLRMAHPVSWCRKRNLVTNIKVGKAPEDNGKVIMKTILSPNTLETQKVLPRTK